ncbi:PAP/OAS1 substrate-binding domain-containing protein, partial [Piromyces finnis]
SLYTQLGLKNSDLDICILTECKEDSKGILEKLKVIFTNLGMKNIVINYAVHTKVCLCTFFDEKEQIDVDISINCEGLLKNVQLFKICDVIDERFRVLVIAIKYWIKQRGIDKGNTVDRMINSYSYILLLIYFLQIQQPPILPNVESIKDLLKERNEHDKNLMESEMFWFKDQEQENKIIKNQLNFPCTNKNNVGRLLVDYFEYFGFEFNYENDVISSRLGHSLTKKEKHWEKSLMCIEDPIYSDINKGNILYPWCYEGIINEFKLAFIKTTEFQKDFIQEVCQPLKEFNYLPPLIYPPIDKFYKRQLLENYVKTLKD